MSIVLYHAVRVVMLHPTIIDIFIACISIRKIDLRQATASTILRKTPYTRLTANVYQYLHEWERAKAIIKNYCSSF